MFRILIPTLVPTLIGLAAESPTVSVGDRYEHRNQAITADAAGNTYVTGARVFKYPSTIVNWPWPSEKSEVFVAKLDAANTRAWIQYFSGKDIEYGTAIATDRDGNIYSAGYTTSPNFPLQNPLQTQPAGAFILKLAANGSRLWSTYYGVSGTRVTSLAVAPDGTLVLAGSIITDSFFNTRAFVTKIDVAANKLLWTEQYGGTQLACTGGSSCFLSARLNSAVVALDAAGNIYAAGTTNTLDFPTTPGAFLERGYGPYIRKLSPAGTVLWSTYLTANRYGEGFPVSPADSLRAVAAGADGSVYFTGGGSAQWPTTAGAYKRAFEAGEPYRGVPLLRNPYVAKMNAAGTALIYSTFIGHSDQDTVSIAVDDAGSACVNGPSDFVTAVNPAGSALTFDASYARGARGTQIALDGRGRIHAAGGLGLITILDRAASPAGISGVGNAAGDTVAGRVAPGELISIYGWNLGDEVFVDELPAPVLYLSAEQVNAVVPFGVESRELVTIVVRRQGVDMAKAVVAITPAIPEIFRIADGAAAALNEDGSVNSAENRARLGSVVTVWGTGAPRWPSGTRDGAINPSDRLIHLDVSAVNGYQPFTEVIFAGAAPGMVAGVFQLNVRLPVIAPVPDTVSIYAISMNEASAPAMVYVKP
jgi:uncharacterized protein (TIGR03437 family)